MIEVSIIYKGHTQAFQVEPDSDVLELLQKVEEFFSVPVQVQKIVHKGKRLLPGSPLSSLGVVGGSKLLLVGATQAEIEEVQSSKADSLLRPFSRPMPAVKPVYVRDLQQRALPSTPYTFQRYEVLTGFPFVQPPPEVCMRMLKRLASDPGIVKIMEKHRWTVGKLFEMPPDGKVGVDPVCVLGYNTNKGQSIALRLRTDDLRGIRKYEVIKKTLIHELTHNVHSDHDIHFKTLNSQLTREAAAFDWTQSHGQSVADIPASSYDDKEDWESEPYYTEEEKIEGGVGTVGGQLEATELKEAGVTAREVAALAALERHSGLVLGSDKGGNGGGKRKRDGEGMEGGGESKSDESRMEDGPSASVLSSSSLSPSNSLSEAPIIIADSPASSPSTAPPSSSFSSSDPLSHMDISPSSTTVEPSSISSHSPSSDSASSSSSSSIASSSSFSSSSQSSPPTSSSSPPSPPSPASPSIPLDSSTADEDSELQEMMSVLEASGNTGVLDYVSKIKTLLSSLEKETYSSSTFILALQTLLLYISNLTQNMQEPKFRKIRKSNQAFYDRLGRFASSSEILRIVGFNLSSQSVEGEFYVYTRDDPGLLWLTKSLVEQKVKSLQRAISMKAS